MGALKSDTESEGHGIHYEESDRRAAHSFLTELRTRIATQDLPYQYGREDRALKSIVELFAKLRDTIKAEFGCSKFAALADQRINSILRPFTAKWHRLSGDGLLASRDGGDAFRRELAMVQGGLRDFAQELSEIAYGCKWQPIDSPTVLSDEELEDLFAPLRAGIPKDKLCNGGIEGEDVTAINEAETEEISKRPPRRSSEPVLLDAFGLALSGGGIRSATFGLGVVQVLAEKGLIDEVDYLSTVSGGGYTGSFLTQQLDVSGNSKSVAAPRGPDTAAIKRLRMRAKFLSAGNLWRAWGMVVTNLGGMLLNWVPPVLVLAVLAAILMTSRAADMPWPWTKLILGSLGCGAIAALLHFSLLRKGNGANRWFGIAFSGFVASAVGFTVGAGLHHLLDAVFLPKAPGGFDTVTEALTHLRREIRTMPRHFGWTGLGLGTLGVLIPTVLRFVPLLKTPALRKLVIKLALIAAGIFVPVLGALVFCLLCTLGSIEGLGGPWALWIPAAALALISIFVLDINLSGPHHLYRAGLSRTFVEVEGKPERSPLHEINPKGHAPYHLLNAAVNLPTSQAEALRERKCDFFLFSKRMTGSPAVGYRPSDEWLMQGRPADLASAMAISGAAFSSNMGLGSIPPMRALLTFLNIRLGFWIRRPHARHLGWFRKWEHPGFLCLLREMAGVAMDEEDRWVNLSDGGHLENLALYELLRRRCKFIIAVDGEADPSHTFHGFMTLIRHARLDLGVRIEPDLRDLRPNPDTGYCRSHYHLCRIHYPATADGREAGTGLLLYIKLSLTGNESELIRRYRTIHPEFPHQTTLDQFFDQEQFEAYRQLGVHVAEGVMSLSVAGCVNSGKASWFRHLAQKLLMPL